MQTLSYQKIKRENKNLLTLVLKLETIAGLNEEEKCRLINVYGSVNPEIIIWGYTDDIHSFKCLATENILSATKLETLSEENEISANYELMQDREGSLCLALFNQKKTEIEWALLLEKSNNSLDKEDRKDDSDDDGGGLSSKYLLLELYSEYENEEFDDSGYSGDSDSSDDFSKTGRLWDDNGNFIGKLWGV